MRAMLARAAKSISKFRQRDDGLAITEYGMLVAFIAFVLIAVVVMFGGGISSWFSSRTSNITTV
jgi:Flp pilus assembly pilin Flp